MVSVSPLFGGCLCSHSHHQCTSAAVYFNTCPPKFLDSVRNWKIKQIKASLFHLSLPCNQSPGVQPSAQRGSWVGGRRTSTEGGSFRLPRIQAGGGGERREKKKKKNRVRTPTQTYAAQTKPAVIFKGCSYSATEFQGTTVAQCELPSNPACRGSASRVCFVSFLSANYGENKRNGETSEPRIYAQWAQNTNAALVEAEQGHGVLRLRRESVDPLWSWNLKVHTLSFSINTSVLLSAPEQNCVCLSSLYLSSFLFFLKELYFGWAGCTAEQVKGSQGERKRFF